MICFVDTGLYLSAHRECGWGVLSPAFGNGDKVFWFSTIKTNENRVKYQTTEGQCKSLSLDPMPKDYTYTHACMCRHAHHPTYAHARAHTHTHTVFNKLPHDLSKMRIISFILSLSSSYLNPFPPLSYIAFYTFYFSHLPCPMKHWCLSLLPFVICLLMTPPST